MHSRRIFFRRPKIHQRLEQTKGQELARTRPGQGASISIERVDPCSPLTSRHERGRSSIIWALGPSNVNSVCRCQFVGIGLWVPCLTPKTTEHHTQDCRTLLPIEDDFAHKIEPTMVRQIPTPITRELFQLEVEPTQCHRRAG